MTWRNREFHKTEPNDPDGAYHALAYSIVGHADILVRWTAEQGRKLVLNLTDAMYARRDACRTVRDAASSSALAGEQLNGCAK